MLQIARCHISEAYTFDIHKHKNFYSQITSIKIIPGLVFRSAATK